jgi:hypothetical protein
MPVFWYSSFILAMAVGSYVCFMLQFLTFTLLGIDGLSVSTLCIAVKNCHIIEENVNQCGHSQTAKDLYRARYQIIF